MTTQGGLEILDWATQARGKILRAEGDRAGTTLGVLALTFDVGRIVVTSSGEGLAITRVTDRGTLPEGLGSLDDEEPWWRLLGNPITEAWLGGVEEGIGTRGLRSMMVLKLRFREETENPHVVRLEATGDVLRVSLEGI